MGKTDRMSEEDEQMNCLAMAPHTIGLSVRIIIQRMHRLPAGRPRGFIL